MCEENYMSWKKNSISVNSLPNGTMNKLVIANIVYFCGFMLKKLYMTSEIILDQTLMITASHNFWHVYACAPQIRLRIFKFDLKVNKGHTRSSVNNNTKGCNILYV